jgi:hypothetical protein
MIRVIERQNEDTTRTYQLEGPKLETVKAFWDYLVDLNEIESYRIEGVN